MKKDLKTIKTIFEKNDLSQPKKVTEFVSGQINRVYDIDDKYVIKFQGDSIMLPQNLLIHQAEISQKLIKLDAKIPEVIDSGTAENSNYLLMKKIKGRTLAQDWFTFSDKLKESMMEQIVQQLRLFHSIEYDKYAIQRFKKIFFSSFRKAILDDINFNRVNKSKLSDKHVKEIIFLEEFYSEKKSLLDKVGKPVFIFNDLHFDNIIYQKNTLAGIIDFDFSCQAPKEYELLLFTHFAYIPTDYVEKKLEKSFKGYDMKKEMQWLKKYYSELFEVDNLPDLIRLYSINMILEFIQDYQSGKSSKKVLEKAIKRTHDFYKTDWLEKILLT